MKGLGSSATAVDARRSIAAHLPAVAGLCLLVVGIYGRIVWGMFLGSDGYRGHIDFARRLYITGRPPVPHFLFHGLTAILFAIHLAPTLMTAGRIVMVGTYVALPVLVYWLLWVQFRGSRAGHSYVVFLAGLVTLIAQPITLAHAYAIGYLWPEPYEIPTSILLKPFALATFSGTCWYLVHRREASLLATGLLALSTLAGSLTKPSFIICLLPAAGLLTLGRLVKRIPVSLAGLAGGLFIPAGAVLLWQFYVTYSGVAEPAMYHDTILWAPLRFMSALANCLLQKFVLSTLFPLLVSVVYWKQAHRDELLQLGWLCFGFGVFYTYMLSERLAWAAGNMVWAGYITLFTLFFACVVFWVRQIFADCPHDFWYWARIVVSGTALAAHVLSGARLDWSYLRHYGCTTEVRMGEFVCAP